MIKLLDLINESVVNEKIKCKNCGHTWDLKDSDESDKYICHVCGYDNKPL